MSRLVRGVTRTAILAGLSIALAGPGPALHAAESAVVTQPELSATYATVADGILALKKSEANIVRAILAWSYGHAQMTLGQAKSKIEAKQDARAEVERLAALVGQLANEGDSTVAGIRKRLLDGGHHHNAAGEQQGIYDEGFVMVTRAARQALLESAGKIGRMASAPDARALETEWQNVSKQYAAVTK